MPTPQRATSGITNVGSQNTMGQLIIPDPTSVHLFMEDFNKFNPGDWFITNVATGTTTGSMLIGDADGGILAIFPNNGDDDSTFLQWKATDHIESASEIFTIEAGKKLWFKARLKISDTGDSDFIIGLQSADTTPTTSPVDFVRFRSDDGDDSLDFGIYAASASKLDDTAIATIVDDTYFTCGFYTDGARMKYYFNDVEVGETTVAFPSAAMTITFGVQNGSAAARTMSVDYITCIKER